MGRIMKTYVKYFKMPFDTKIFRKNQKVWVIFIVGSYAVYVCGKYRGRGRYVRGWVNYSSKTKLKIMEQTEWKCIEVEKDFAEKI